MKYLCSFYFLIFLFQLPFGTSAYAQRFGLSGGASVDPITSLRLSAIFEADIKSWLNIQTELAYFRKGHTSLVDRFLENHPDYGYGAMDMVSWPILLKLRMQWKDFTAYLLAGPEISLSYRAMAVYLLEDAGYKREQVPFEVFEVKKWDWGMTFGLGLEKHIRTDKRLFIDFRYYLGLNNINLNARSVLYLEALYFNFGMLIPIHAQVSKNKSQPH